jgi:hypothetical protein
MLALTHVCTGEIMLRKTIVHIAPVAALTSCLFTATPALGGLVDTVYGVTNNGFLARWQSNTPGTFDSGVFISGLQNNETIIGLDSRPATGELIGVGSSNRLYTINPVTGAATQIGSAFANAVNGTSFGFDFNPTIDRARLVSNTDQNMVINPNDGTNTLATNLFFGAGDPNVGVNPNIVDNAYTNSVFGGSATSQQYAIDSGVDVLTTLANNAGTLGTVGSLGVNVDAVGGFDISGATGVAYAALLANGGSASGFYTIDLSTGAASLVGQLDGGVVITAMTVQIVPAPGALALLGLAGVMAGGRRRRA